MTDEQDDEPEAKRPVRRARPFRPLRWIAVLLVCVVPLAALGVLAGMWWHARQQESAARVASLAPLLPGAPVLRRPATPPAATVPAIGFDVSYPQCGMPLPKSGGFAIVGLSGGRPLSANRCAAAQLAWATAKAGHAVYVNTGYSGTGDPVEHGRLLVDDAVSREHALGVTGTAVWWLDVETVNTWGGTHQQNATVLDSMATRLQELGVRVGIYSTPKMWDEIAGTWSPGLPVWFATGPGTQTEAAASCAREFAGSQAAIVQWVETTADGELDRNLICPAYLRRAAELLDLG